MDVIQQHGGHYINAFKKKILFVFSLVLLISFASAVTLDSGTILNTSVSNSSMTFPTVTVFVDQVDVEDTFIYLYNASWTNVELVVNLTENVNWSEENDHLDSSVFGYLTTSTPTTKVIDTDFQEDLTANLAFDVDNCANLGRIYYTPFGSPQVTYSRGDYTCEESRVSIEDINITYLGDNIFTLEYGCSTFYRTGSNLIMIFGSIIIIFFMGMYIWTNWEDFTLGKVMLMFIIVIIAITLWYVSAINLGSNCPIGG